MHMKLQLWTHPILIDIGSAYVTVAVPHLKKIQRFPSFVVRHRDTGNYVMAGEQAKQLWGKTTPSLEVIHPIRYGVVADVEATVALVEWVFKQLQQQVSAPSWLFYPHITVLVPNSITPVQTKALSRVWQQLSLRPVSYVSSGFAQLAGLELPRHDAAGKLIVDLGEMKTEISIVGNNKFFYSTRLHLGGYDFTVAIQRQVRATHALEIGVNAAEQVKIAIASILPIVQEVKSVSKKKETKENPGKTLVVRGRNITTGLPESVVLSQNELLDSLQSNAIRIQDKITEALEEVSPDLAGDVVTQGIYLTGGGANLSGLREHLSHVFGTQVFVQDEPALVGIKGAQSVSPLSL